VRLTRIHLCVLIVLLMAIIGPAVFSQPNPGRGGKGGRGGRGGMFGDPSAFWDQIAQGKDSVKVNEVQFPPQMQFFAERIRQGWSDFLQKKGITNGIMTKELYLEQSEERRRAWGGGGMGGKGKGWQKGGDKSASPPSPETPRDPKEEDAKIEEEGRRFFTMLDRNKDNVIDKEEARFSPTLRDFDRYDLNKDGKISVDEYVEAYRDEQAQRGRGSRAQSGDVILPAAAPPVEEKRPTVYRAGKLPKELPPWFAQLDKDNDGQVGLYEWKAAGKTTIEFLAMDANGDGFLTVEEVLRFQKVNKKAGKPGPGGVAGQRGRGPGGPGPWSPGAGGMGQGGGDGERRQGTRMRRGGGRRGADKGGAETGEE
jgi:Ca2+-binding EF-hand superfamily protein